VQLERRLIARLKTADIRFTDAQIERIWAIVSAHEAGLSIRKIASATGLSSSRIHQLLNAPEQRDSSLAEPIATIERRFRSKGKSSPAWAGNGDPIPLGERSSGVATLHWVAATTGAWSWNLRPDEDVETEFVAFDRPRVVRVLERIAADLDNLSLVPNDPHGSNHHDPRAVTGAKEAESPRAADRVASSAGTTATVRKCVQKTERLSAILGSAATGNPTTASNCTVS